MKTICFNIILGLLLIPVANNSNTEFNGRYTKQKKITKEYRVSEDALLKIDNSYGNIDITTWDENRIEIEVIVKTNGNDEEEVIERLREIDVRFQHSNSMVSAESIFETRDSSWWDMLFNGGSNVNMQINYIVRAPATNDVELENDYGNISLDRLEGNAKISCDYGRLLIGELLGKNNYLSFDYTTKSHIDYVERAKIDADYSEYHIEEAELLEISADYTEGEIEKVENIKFDCDYGSLSINKLRNIKGDGDYLAVDLGAVYHSVELDVDYGSISIEKLMGNLENLDINSDYTNIQIGYDSDNAFSFEINTNYGNVKGLNAGNFQFNEREENNSDTYYRGFYLSETGGKINIDSSYGNVTFSDR